MIKAEDEYFEIGNKRELKIRKRTKRSSTLEMSLLSFVMATLLLAPSLSLEVDELPRKQNMVSRYLNSVLDPIFEKLSTGNFSIPDINFGEDVGRVSKMVGGISGGLEKQVDGIGGFGFKLDTEVRKFLLKGYYDLLNLDVPGLFPFFGSGDFSLYLDAVLLNLTLNANYNSEKEGFDVEISKLNIVVQNSTVNFENLMNDPHLADFLNTLISNLIPDLVTMFIEPILSLSKPVIDFYGNGIIICIKDNILSKEKTRICIENLFTSMTGKVFFDLGTKLMKAIDF